MVRGLNLPADLLPGNATRSIYWCFSHKRFRSAEDVLFHIQNKSCSKKTPTPGKTIEDMHMNVYTVGLVPLTTYIEHSRYSTLGFIAVGYI
jgi:hypothetical protein